ncbi:MAG: serine/threonine protein kinase [Lentisphaerae bacterium]|nr:serine/threonine protein kinase [Lentisphaerota bacterium]
MPLPLIKGYEIIRTLGEGGMGAVYLARQLSLNRLVAVKILPDYLAENPSYVIRFRQEAKAAGKLKHNNMVQIYDAGVESDVFYFVMEYIDGETAGRRVARKGRLDEESTLLIGEAVAVALEYAWDDARLVHRDIKPDNILIDGDGTVKVADLGNRLPG